MYIFKQYFQITQDFNIRHPNLAYVLYERWPMVSKLLFDYALESQIDYGKVLEIAKPRYDLTAGTFLLALFEMT